MVHYVFVIRVNVCFPVLLVVVQETVVSVLVLVGYLMN